MRRRYSVGLLVAVLVATLSAQSVVRDGSTVLWSQDAPSLTEAQGYTYRAYIDSAATMLSATCSGAASPYACSALLPSSSVGGHTLTVSAANAGGESSPSAAIQIARAPLAPQAYRLSTTEGRNVATQTRLPTAVGTISPGTWNIGTSTPGNEYLEIDDPIGSSDDDTTYIATDAAGNIDLQFAAFDLTASSIAAVRVYIRARNTSGANVLEGRLNIASTTYTNTPQSLTSSYVTYVFTWTTNPATGAAWTENDVKRLSGAPLDEFRVRASSVSGAETVRVTQAYIEVDYTPVGGSVSPLAVHQYRLRRVA